ncbi:MAG: anti-sigma factor, partial [Burkholderiales bacterium]|nr:anti-sigma factor [Burkholderiales bacterium]
WLPQLRGAAWQPAELVADHVRALGAGPLIEVASSDRHTVKPWFQGRIDYAPPVYDLKDEGFALIGGRIARVGGAPVATLAFRHGRHVVDVFVWPAQALQAERASQVRGFNVLHWSDASMQFWVVSDADAAELERFASAWRARAAAPR